MIPGAEKHLEYLTRCLAYADEAEGTDRVYWLNAAARFWRGAIMIERSQTLLIESKQLLSQIDEAAAAAKTLKGTVAPARSSVDGGSATR